MFLQAFREINEEMFSFSKEETKLNMWKLATGVAAVAGALGFYLKIPDSVMEWMFYRLTEAKTAKTSFENWQQAGHTGLRLLSLVSFFVLFYLIVFAFYAIKRLDYRAQVARALGIRFSLVKREHLVLNLQGDCKTTSTETFTVGDLQLAYIDRRLQVPPGVTRSAPVITVEGLPAGTNAPLGYKDAGGLRTYQVNFAPPLHKTLQLVSMKIGETIEKGIFMDQASTPVHPIFRSKVESISLLVVEPIDRLELSATFPPGYGVGGALQISVRYGRTATVHDIEEQRLKSNGALKPDNNGGQQTLRLVVDLPMMGLQYYLFWEPPQ